MHLNSLMKTPLVTATDVLLADGAHAAPAMRRIRHPKMTLQARMSPAHPAHE